MNILGYNVTFGKETSTETISTQEQVDATFRSNIGFDNPIIEDDFDGEKTPGELGAVLDTIPDYEKLRLRSYDAHLKTDLIRIMTGKFFKALIGSGLKLQSEPVENVLKMNGINISSEELITLRKNIESSFNLFATSTHSDYNEQVNLHDNANMCYKDAFLGGDCLYIIRVTKKGINLQVIDGSFIKQPCDNDAILKDKSKDGLVIDGVEVNEKGSHIAYYVHSKTVGNQDKWDRVECKDKKGRVVSKLVYGDKHRMSNLRGVPRTASILQKTNVLDRYTEATTQKREQSANVLYTIEHDEHSTGENPVKPPGNSRLDYKTQNTEEDTYKMANNTANRVQQSSSNTTINMPRGAKLKAFEGGENQSDYEGFSKTVFMYLCASIEIPYEVALQAYNSNYSASRAAINAWEQILSIVREKFARDFYGPVYKMYFDYMVLSEKITAPGYLEAMRNGDWMVTEAYTNSRWVGQKTPHIDPLKEMKAIGEMIDKDLIPREQATEMMNLGDWNENYKKIEEEKKVLPKEPVIEPNTNNTNTNQDA